MCEKDAVNRNFETLYSNHMSAFSQMKVIIPLQLLYFPVSPKGHVKDYVIQKRYFYIEEKIPHI